MGALVNGDVPPFVMVAQRIATAAPRGINAEGLKRRGFDAERIASDQARLPHAVRGRRAAGRSQGGTRPSWPRDSDDVRATARVHRARRAAAAALTDSDGRIAAGTYRAAPRSGGWRTSLAMRDLPHSEPSLRIALVAGEASGDLLGAGLMRELRARFPMPNSPASAATRCARRLRDLVRRQRTGGDGPGRSAAPPAAPAEAARRVPRNACWTGSPTCSSASTRPTSTSAWSAGSSSAACAPCTTSARRCGPGARSARRRSGPAPTACCACSRWNRRSTRGMASMRASSAIRSPTRFRCNPTATRRACDARRCRECAGAGAAAGQPARRDRAHAADLPRGRLAVAERHSRPARAGAGRQRALPRR